jgi:hypothetical protein
VREIVPGVWHWVREHPKIGVEVSSYYLAAELALVDPLEPKCGWDKLPTRPEHVLLTNRHHFRHADQAVERWGVTVWCAEPGLHEFADGRPVRGFRFGERLPCGVTPVEIGAICPDEAALLVPKARAVALGDGVVRDDTGPLSFVPDAYMGSDPARVKAGLRDAYRRLAASADFDHLLLAHGAPWPDDGKRALLDFVGRAAT